MMEKSRLTEAQAIEIARQEFSSLGGAGDDYITCAFFNGVTWNVEIIPKVQDNLDIPDIPDIPEIRIYDKTGLVVPHHVVKAQREASTQAYQEELKAANLSKEEFVEIAKEVAVRRGFRDFSISCPTLKDGFWGAIISSDHIDSTFGFNFDEVSDMVYVDDETGSVVDSPRRQ